MSRSSAAPVDVSGVSAWELKKFLSWKTRRLQFIYRCLVVTVIVIFIGLCGHVIFYYNYLTDLQYDVLTAEGKVSAAVQYRRNLAPVLVESVVSFVKHEDDVFNRTIDARERQLTAGQRLAEELRRRAKGMAKPGQGKSRSGKDPLEGLAQRILAFAEQYPQLKTSDAFGVLMKQVSDAEGKILLERARYNDTVNKYTTALSMFPGNVYGYIFGFITYDYFKDKAAPEWDPVQLSRQPVGAGRPASGQRGGS